VRETERAHLHAEKLRLLWHAVQLTWVQFTPQGRLPAFIVLWHTKQAGTPFFVWFTR